MAPTVDVVVVGAGLSGLQAALDVQDAGLSYVVLEARDRVGGKTWSQPRSDGKGIQELGAAWINDTNQSHIWKLVQKFGLSTVVQATDGGVGFQDTNSKAHAFTYGELPKFSKGEQDDIARIRDIVEAACHDASNFTGSKRSSLDSVNFDTYLRAQGAGKRALESATLWCHGMLGVEPSELSTLCFLELCRSGGGIINMRNDRKHGPQYLRIQEGTQSISINMARLLKPESLRLSTPVAAITQLEKSLVGVTTSTGETILARRVIVSIPAPTYKNIAFSPALPVEKTAYITGARYGFYTKFIIMFKKPIWRDNGACGLATSVAGPASIFRDTSVDAQQNYALTCFIGATTGRKWDTLSPTERETAILKQVSQMFGLDESYVKANFIESLMSPWMRDKWAGYGCPIVSTPPGVLGAAGPLLTKPFNGIHFVGTELTDVWRGYMEGALRSGERGAKEVIDALSSSARL